MTTLKKLPQVKPDLVRVDDNWEEWDMKKLIENGSKETRLMTLPLTVRTIVEGNGTGTQRENGKMAASLEALLAYIVKVTTGGKPVKFSTP